MGRSGQYYVIPLKSRMCVFMEAGIENLKNVVETLFYILTIVLAYAGLNTWKTQLRGTSEYELAKAVISGVYRVRDSIFAAQAPFMSAGEWSERVEKPAETATQRDALNAHFAYKKRLQRVWDERSALYPSIIEAEALHGDEASQLFKKLFESIAKLSTAVETHFKLMYHDNLNYDDLKTRSRENILYGMNKKTNPTGESEEIDDANFREELDRAIGEIRDYFSKFIHHK